MFTIPYKGWQQHFQSGVLLASFSSTRLAQRPCVLKRRMATPKAAASLAKRLFPIEKQESARCDTLLERKKSVSVMPLDSHIGVGEPVVLAAGSLLLVSASHLHQSLPNLSDRVRFSIDLRLVHRGDLWAGRGAPNVDNRSSGGALADYTW